MGETNLPPGLVRETARVWWNRLTYAAIAVGGVGVIFGKLRPAGGWGQSVYGPWYWECWMLLAAGTVMYVLPMFAGLWQAERKHAPLKSAVGRVHAELKAGAGENPSWGKFLSEFERRYPEQKVSEDGLEDLLRRWWKKLNAGRGI